MCVRQCRRYIVRVVPSTGAAVTVSCVTDAQNEWPRELVAAVGREVKRLTARGSLRPLTAQQLADLMTELGTPMTRTTVSDLLNGRRGAHLTVPELVSLGRILDVPPALLAFSGYPDAEYQIGGDGETGTSEGIVNWWTGRDPGPGLRRFTAKDGRPVYYPRNAGKWQELVKAVEERAELDSTLIALADSLDVLADIDQLDVTQRLAIEELRTAAAHVRAQRDEINDRIRALGGVVEDENGEG